MTHETWRSSLFDVTSKARGQFQVGLGDYKVTVYFLVITTKTKRVSVTKHVLLDVFHVTAPLFIVLKEHIGNNVERLANNIDNFEQYIIGLALRWYVMTNPTPMRVIKYIHAPYVEDAWKFYVTPQTHLETARYLDAFCHADRDIILDGIQHAINILRNGLRISSKNRRSTDMRIPWRLTTLTTAILALLDIQRQELSAVDYYEYRHRAHFSESCTDRFYFLVKRAEFFAEQK